MRQDADPLPKHAAPIESIYCVHEALTHQGLDIPLPYLMAVSGEPFRISYNRNNPEQSIHTVFHNPLRTVCRVMGLKYELHYDAEYKTAWNRLYQNVKEGRIALIPFDNGHPFFAASSEPDQVLGKNGYTKAFSAKELERKWLSIKGFYELGLDGYYQFLIEDRDRLPDERETAYSVFRLARKLMRIRRKIDGSAMGTEAYQALSNHIEDSIKQTWEVSETDFRDILKWGQVPLSQILEGKDVILSYLQSIQNNFEDRELVLFDEVIAIYQQMARLLRNLKIKFQFSSQLLADLTESNEEINGLGRSISQRFRQKRFYQSLRACQKLILSVSSLEYTAIEKFGAIIRLSEKLKI